jgi:hypothetical protein
LQLVMGKPIGTLVSISSFKINGILLQSKYVQSPATLVKKWKGKRNVRLVLASMQGKCSTTRTVKIHINK